MYVYEGILQVFNGTFLRNGNGYPLDVVGAP